MKINQITYALTVARTRSFSRASKELFVSQPSISSAISHLEDELGFQIFERTNQGVSISDKGLLFLEHARNIQTELDEINDLSEAAPLIKFRIGNMFKHSLVRNAFSELCLCYIDQPRFHFSLYTRSKEEIIEDVYINQTQLGLLITNSENKKDLLKEISKKKLSCQVLREMDMNINVRQGHPFLEQGDMNFNRLYQYPFVNYSLSYDHNINSILNFSNNVPYTFINPERIIEVDEIQARKEIVLSSDAFSMGVAYKRQKEEKNAMVSIPLPNQSIVILLIMKNDRRVAKELNHFIELLHAQIDSTLTQLTQ